MPTKLAQTFAQVHALLLMIPRLRAHALKMRKSPNGMKIVDARHVDIPHKPQHMPAQNMHGVTEHAQRHDAQCACVPCPVSIISRRAPSVNPESQMRTPGSSTPPRPLSHLHRPRGHLRLSPDGFHVPEVPAKSKEEERGEREGDGAVRRSGKSCRLTVMGAKWLFQLRSAPGQQTSTLHLFERFEALGAQKVSKWKSLTISYARKVPQGGSVPDKVSERLEGTVRKRLLSESAPQVASDVYMVQFPTDTPDKVYMVIKDKQGHEDKVMEAGSGLALIWHLMNPAGGANSGALYEQRVSMTVDGWAYELGDLVVRVGSMVVRHQGSGNQQAAADARYGRSESFKGAVLEVEYLPSCDKQDCNSLIAEFIDVYCNPDGPTAVPVPHFQPTTSVVSTKGNGPPSGLHWQSRSKEYIAEHRAQQYVALFLAVNKPSGVAGGSGATAAGST